MGGGQCRRWLARALSLALVSWLLLAPTAAEALSWRLPGRGAPAPTPAGDGQLTRRPREVPPPDWVQAVQAALEDRDPKVRVLAPADGALLPDGPWTLRLLVEDWPLVDAGPLGLGPHLVAQLDGEPPRPLVRTEVEMPPLSPGSHLLTVYAAMPWGEARKSPTAFHQIRLHRLAPNPATLPAPGTPQLIPVSPMGSAGTPPLPLDWLLIDAPLQGLRTEASGWRLRVTLNGESVLLDRQVPLWLKGWQPGSNALLFELLDGRGEPLNPPFNSLLRDVVVSPSGEVGRPGGLALSDLERAVLLGEQPLSALNPVPLEPPPSEGAAVAAEPPQARALVEPAAPPQTEAQPQPEAMGPVEPRNEVPAQGSPIAASDALAEAPPNALAEAPAEAPGEASPEPPAPAPIEAPLEPRAEGPVGEPADARALFDASASPDPRLKAEAKGLADTLEQALAEAKAEGRAEALAKTQALAQDQFPQEPQGEPSAPSLGSEPLQSLEPTPSAVAGSQRPAPTPEPVREPPPPPSAPVSSPALSARAEVNPDGTLKRPSRPSPLERLRERLRR